MFRIQNKLSSTIWQILSILIHLNDDYKVTLYMFTQEMYLLIFLSIQWKSMVTKTV